MKHFRYKSIGIVLIMINLTLNLQADWNYIVGTAKGLMGTVGNVANGLLQSLGKVPSSWQYSCVVWNDCDRVIFAVEQNITSFMGANLDGPILTTTVIAPYSNSTDALMNEQMYVALYVCHTKQKDPSKESDVEKSLHKAVLAENICSLYIPYAIQRWNLGEKYTSLADTSFKYSPAGWAAKGFNLLGHVIYKGSKGNVVGQQLGATFSDIGGLDIAVNEFINAAMGQLIVDVAILNPISLIVNFIVTEKLEHDYAIKICDLMKRRVILFPMKNTAETADHYRAYEYHGDQKVEFLSQRTTSTHFSGVIYNNSDESAGLTFFKGGKPFVNINIEPHSFNFLNSGDKQDEGIRPSVLLFNLNTQPNLIPLNASHNTIMSTIHRLASQGELQAFIVPAIGLANKPGQDATDQTPIPMNYTYEIYRSANNRDVCIQGVGIGNYDQPTNNRVRDINPVEINLWNQSAEQAQDIDDKQKAKLFFKVYIGAALVTIIAYIVFAYEHFISQFYLLQSKGPSPFQYVMTAGGLISFFNK